MKPIASNFCAALLLSLGLYPAISVPAQADGGGGSHGSGMAGMSRGSVGLMSRGAIAPIVGPRLGAAAAPTMPTMPGSTPGTAVAPITGAGGLPSTGSSIAEMPATSVPGQGLPTTSNGLAINQATGLPVGTPDFNLGSSSLGSSSTSGSTDPRDLSNQPATTVTGGTAPETFAPGESSPLPAGTGTPSGTAFPSGEALEAARENALQGPPGSAIPPAATGINEDSIDTSQTTGDAATQQSTPGLPAAPLQNPSLLDPSQLAAGGTPNINGAKGSNFKDCVAAWDKATHMSKSEWLQSCRETMTPEHL
jgi:hypothetical protein